LAFLNTNYKKICTEIANAGVELIAVSKTKPVEDLMEAYHEGVRHFGENYVQELVDKQAILPKDIHWHFIGHLQSNKVKYIAPFVHLIHGVDSEKLLLEINKQAKKQNRIVHCLLQIHIAQEETKFGLDQAELNQIIQKYLINSSPEKLDFVSVDGLMGMASFSSDTALLKYECQMLHHYFEDFKHNPDLIHQPKTLSMGMSSDYNLAIACGSNMIRVGSLIFGERNYSKS
jgi:pyridoxal phosphate enzyme (YggS family)